MPILNDKEYKCDLCGGVFGLIRDETWSDDKANQEYNEMFPGESMNNRDVVCEDCWNKVRPDAQSSR
jgi:DNA-directed RNA polymerase subunit RPC12/RpoP